VAHSSRFVPTPSYHRREFTHTHTSMKFSKSFTTKIANKEDPYKIPIKAKAVLPLVPKTHKTKEELEARKLSKFMVNTNPANANAGKYETYVYHIDGSEEARDIIEWKKTIEDVTAQLNIQTGEDVISMTKGQCEGAARIAYENKIAERRAARQAEELTWLETNPVPVRGQGTGVPANETVAAFNARRATHTTARTAITTMTVDDHNLALRQVLTDLLPYRALIKQQRFMKLDLRKPYGMGIRVFVSHLLRLNVEELPELPPFGGMNQALTAQEIREVVVNSCPEEWKHTMIKHNFIPEQNTLQDIVAFCERLESVDNEGKTTKQNANGGNKGKKKPENEPKNEGKWCAIHKSKTHNTEDCYSNPKNKKADNKPFHKNRTWNKNKADESKSITAKEVNAIIRQYLDHHKKAKNDQGNKRKAEAHAVELLPSSDENEEEELMDYESDIEASEEALAEIDRQLAEINALEEANKEASA